MLASAFVLDMKAKALTIDPLQGELLQFLNEFRASSRDATSAGMFRIRAGANVCGIELEPDGDRNEGEIGNSQSSINFPSTWLDQRIGFGSFVVEQEPIIFENQLIFSDLKSHFRRLRS